MAGEGRYTFGAVLRIEDGTPGAAVSKLLQMVYDHFGGQDGPGIELTDEATGVTCQLVLVGLGPTPGEARRG